MAVADELRKIYSDETFDYNPDTPDVSTNFTSEAARRLQDTLRSHTPPFSDETPRTRRQSKKSSSSVSTLLLLTTERLSLSNSRVSELESRVSALLDFLKQITLARDNAVAQVARLADEVSHYKIQFEKAQQEIFKADDIIRRLTERNREAEEDASRHRERLRKMLEEKSIALAREEGRRAGFREGWVRAEQEVRLLEGPRFSREREHGSSVGGIPSSDPGLTTTGTTTSTSNSRRSGRSRDRSAPPPTQRRHTADATIAPARHEDVSHSAPSDSILGAIRSTTPPGIPPVASRIQPKPPMPRSHTPEPITPAPPANAPPQRPAQPSSTISQRTEFVATPENFIPLAVNQRISLPPPHEMTRPVSLRNLRDQLRTPAPEPPILIETLPDGPPIVQIPKTPRDASTVGTREIQTPFPGQGSGYEASGYQAAIAPPGPRPPPVIPALDEGQAPAGNMSITPKQPSRTRGRWPSRSRRVSTAASTRISDYDLLGAPHRPTEGEEVTTKRSLEKVAQWRGTMGSSGSMPPEPVVPVPPQVPIDESRGTEFAGQDYASRVHVPPVIPAIPSTHPPPPVPAHPQPPPVVPPRSRPGSPINWLRSAFRNRGRMYSSTNTIPIAVQSPSECTTDGSLSGPPQPNRNLLTPEPQTLVTSTIQDYIEERFSPKTPQAFSDLPSSPSPPIVENMQNLPPGFIPHASPTTNSESRLYFNGEAPSSSTSSSGSIFIAPETTSSKSFKTSSVKPMRPHLTYEEAPSPSSPPVLVYPDRIVRPASVNTGGESQGTRGRGASFDSGAFGQDASSRLDRRREGLGNYYAGHTKGNSTNRQRAMSVGSSTASAPLARPFSIFDE